MIISIDSVEVCRLPTFSIWPMVPPVTMMNMKATAKAVFLIRSRNDKGNWYPELHLKDGQLFDL